jgi:DNA polymerase
LLSENFVPGDGPDDADVMVIGEAPGASEDEQGRPFVGRAGALLDEALEGAGLRREDVYVTNVVKRRPPNNRTPLPIEVAQFIGILVEEISRIRPKFVLLLGNTALSALTMYPGGIMSRRGKLAHAKTVFAEDAVVFATIHPSAALRNPSLKQGFLDDVKQFAEEYIGSYRKDDAGAHE